MRMCLTLPKRLVDAVPARAGGIPAGAGGVPAAFICREPKSGWQGLATPDAKVRYFQIPVRKSRGVKGSDPSRINAADACGKPAERVVFSSFG